MVSKITIFPQVKFGYPVNPTSNVPSADTQIVPRDSRHTDRNVSPGPGIDSRAHSSQGSIHNLPPTLPRNGLPRSDSPLSLLRDRRPNSIVVPNLPTQPRRLPSTSASTSGHPPSLSTDMDSLRLAPGIHVIYSLEQLFIFL